MCNRKDLNSSIVYFPTLFILFKDTIGTVRWAKVGNTLHRSPANHRTETLWHKDFPFPGDNNKIQQQNNNGPLSVLIELERCYDDKEKYTNCGFSLAHQCRESELPAFRLCMAITLLTLIHSCVMYNALLWRSQAWINRRIASRAFYCGQGSAKATLLKTKWQYYKQIYIVQFDYHNFVHLFHSL